MLNTQHSLIYMFRLTRSLAIRWMGLGLTLVSQQPNGVSALYDIVHRRPWIAPSALRFYQLWIYVRLFPDDRAYHGPFIVSTRHFFKRYAYMGMPNWMKLTVAI